MLLMKVSHLKEEQERCEFETNQLTLKRKDLQADYQKLLDFSLQLDIEA